MDLRLRPLREDEFDAYFGHGRAAYGRQMVDHGGKAAFVYSVEIFEACRRRGFGRAAMLASGLYCSACVTDSASARCRAHASRS